MRLSSHSTAVLVFAVLVLATSTCVQAGLTYNQLPRRLRDVVAGRAVAGREDIVQLVGYAADPYGYRIQTFDVTGPLPLAFAAVGTLSTNTLLAAYVRTPLSIGERHTALLLVVPDSGGLADWRLVPAYSVSDDLQAPLFADDTSTTMTGLVNGLLASIISLKTQRQ